jgi:hypothetical protein
VGISPLGQRILAQVVRRFFDCLKNRLGFSRRPMWTVARTSKERKRKSSGTKTAWVFDRADARNQSGESRGRRVPNSAWSTGPAATQRTFYVTGTEQEVGLEPTRGHQGGG